MFFLQKGLNHPSGLKLCHVYLNSLLSLISILSDPIICCINLVAPTILTKIKCGVLCCRGILKGLCCPKNGDRSFALNPVSWTGPSLRDHLVKFYRPSHDAAQTQQSNLPPSIKMCVYKVSVV